MARDMPANTSTTTTQPFVYVVGTQHIHRPLVSAEHVKGHIRLLRAFYNLRIAVEDCKDRRIPAYAVKMDMEARWRWFVHLAVERFERWVKSLQCVPLDKFVTEHMPPVDVWMVWHAYLLSPCWYAEDCERLAMMQQLRLLNTIVVSSINISKLVQLEPSNARMETWLKQTGTPFNPFEATTATETRHKELECPRCRTMVYVPFVNQDGTGFAEDNFRVSCPLPGCRLDFSHENLAVAKFVRDLAGGDEMRDPFVAGSLYCPSGKRDARQAKVVRDQLLRSAYFSALGSSTDERLERLDRIKEVKENIGYSLKRLREAITTSLRNWSACSVTRVLSAYTNGSPFSINLVDGVLRQCYFVDRLDELGWLRSGVFRQPHKREILVHSIVRYHAFLDLMTVHLKPMVVPTLDVDLVWHTHQLMASRYNVDCEMYVGRLVDHDLSASETQFSSALEETSRAWQTRFQTPYMQCGCTVPDETSVHKFIRLVRSYFSGRPQLQVALHPEHLPATHPSTHSALHPSDTVCGGALWKMKHACKRKEERSQSRSHSPNTNTEHPKRTPQMDTDWTLSLHSPTHLQKQLPARPRIATNV